MIPVAAGCTSANKRYAIEIHLVSDRFFGLLRYGVSTRAVTAGVLQSETCGIARCRALEVSMSYPMPLRRPQDTGLDARDHSSRILYCADFSNNSEQAREYAISVAAEHGAELTLHVAENAPDLARAEAIIRERTKELDKLVSDTERKNFAVRSAVGFGKPYEEIVRYATESRTSLIIMTARGGDAVDRAVFGSTTYRVIQLGP
jgi:nucleotide-binding universal stress UspA family protein